MTVTSYLGKNSMWDAFWDGLTPTSEIQMWDFYGGRPWVLKHTPRYGKVVEAGCGLGRYVFYLSRLGIDIEGLDFHEPTVKMVRQWGQEQDLGSTFRVGDVSRLPYEDGSLSGYLSFGVIEHFQEGPSKALAETFRVLRPGGVAVISTPAFSFAQMYLRLWRRAKERVKLVIGRPIIPRSFFQYWYTCGQLHTFVQTSGLKVILSGTCDLKYAFWELLGNSRGRSSWFSIADILEKTPLARWGAQAFTVSVKVDKQMHCFLCGRKNVYSHRWEDHYIPVCGSCSSLPIASYYRRKKRPKFERAWQYNPSPLSQNRTNRGCYFCKQPVYSDSLFEDYGFSIPICRDCLQVPEKNLVASCEFLQPRWRPRKPIAAQ